MNGQLTQYFRNPDRLYTDRWPWEIDGARIDAGEDAVLVEMYGETVDIATKMAIIKTAGAVGLACPVSPRAFPDYDDDPRLLAIAHAAAVKLDVFKNEGGADPTGAVDVPDLQAAVRYCRANGIPVPEWVG